MFVIIFSNPYYVKTFCEPFGSYCFCFLSHRTCENFIITGSRKNTMFLLRGNICDLCLVRIRTVTQILLIEVFHGFSRPPRRRLGLYLTLIYNYFFPLSVQFFYCYPIIFFSNGSWMTASLNKYVAHIGFFFFTKCLHKYGRKIKWRCFVLFLHIGTIKIHFYLQRKKLFICGLCFGLRNGYLFVNEDSC